MAISTLGGHPARFIKAKTTDAKTTDERRKKLIQAVHASARKLGLNDDARRDVYLREVNKRSLTDMTTTQIGKVLDALNVQTRTPQQDYRTAWARKAKLDRHGFSTGWSSGNNAALYYVCAVLQKCISRPVILTGCG
jgi:hypothetical protein